MKHIIVVHKEVKRGTKGFAMTKDCVCSKLPKFEQKTIILQVNKASW